MACFIFGFLMTAMPRFSSTPHATGRELLAVFLLISAIVGFLWAQLWILAEISFILLLLNFVRFAVVRFSKRGQGEKHLPPSEFIWIPIAVLHGIVGSLVLILFQSGLIPGWFGDIGEDMATQGFVLAIVSGIGSFMAPRLMGLYEGPKLGETCTPEQLIQAKKRQVWIHFILGALLFLSFLFETETMERISHSLRALVVTGVFFFTRSLPRFPRSRAFFSRLIWVSLWMVLIGLWLTAFFPAYEKTTLHFTFLGGFSLMAFAVATMVVLSHAGEAGRLQKPLFILKLIAFGIVGALGFRIAAVFVPDLFFLFLAVASIFWILIGVSWLCFIAPVIFKASDPETFERQHEEMKQRLQVGCPPNDAALRAFCASTFREELDVLLRKCADFRHNTGGIRPNESRRALWRTSQSVVGQIRRRFVAKYK
jgi:uncharacterized protein involved in response to NO